MGSINLVFDYMGVVERILVILIVVWVELNFGRVDIDVVSGIDYLERFSCFLGF